MTTFKRPALTVLALGFALATVFGTPAMAQADNQLDRWDLTSLY